MSGKYKPPDYEAIERRLWRRAHRKVVKEAHKKADRLLKRIETYVSRFGYTENSVLRKIKQDRMFAALFAEAPRRTSFHQRVAGEWIEKLPSVREFESLPPRGKNALKVSRDGKVETERGSMKLPGKSLDFRWKTGDTTFYAMHKYTKEGGGNQDSQYQEMVELMRRFASCRDKGIALVVIVDGNYYQEDGARRLNELRNHERDRPPKSFALPIEQLPDILERY